MFKLPVLKYLERGDELWLSEGITDAIAHLSAGHKCIGIPSATCVKADDLACLSYFVQNRAVTLHCAPDNDLAGSKMFASLQKVCHRLELPLVRHQLPADCKDFSNYYAKRRMEHNDNFSLLIDS